MNRSSSVYEHLREQLRHALVNPGGAGDRLPSERKLAEDFGVSPVTVSRALQELQNEGVIQRIPGKGTFILPNKKTERISAPLTETPSLQDPFGYANLLPWEAATTNGRFRPGAGMAEVPNALIVAKLSMDPPSRSREYWDTRATSRLERCIQQCGGRTRVVNLTNTNLEGGAASLAKYLEGGVNSVILATDSTGPEFEAWGAALLERLYQPEAARFAVVQIQWNNLHDWPFDTVSFSGAAGARAATLHLLNLRHRNLAFLSPAPNCAWAQERHASFRRTLLGAGIPAAPVLYNEDTPTIGWKDYFPATAERLLDEYPGVTGVVAANDRMAHALMTVAERRGIAVPEQISVVGFDDWNHSVQLGLSTIHIPVEEMAEAAASLVIRRLNQPGLDGHMSVSIDPSLIVRSSTAPPP